MPILCEALLGQFQKEQELKKKRKRERERVLVRERKREMRGLKRLMSKKLGEMGFNTGGGVINWFPGHMAAATRAIRDRLKLSDLVIEVRDARVRTSFFSLCLLVCVCIYIHMYVCI